MLTAFPPARAADALSPGAPLQLAGTKGRFDFISIDPERRRLLAAHTGNGSLDVIDLDKGTLVKSIPCGAAQDCVADLKGKRYLVSVSKPPQLAIIDAETLVVTSTIALDGPADLLAWHAASGRAYAGHDDGRKLWILDPSTKKVTGKVELPGEAPEGLAFDAEGSRLFQAMKIDSTLSVIDVTTGKVVSNWPTAPAKAPHGIALIRESEAIAVAGGNGKLVLMSQADGKVLSSGDIPERVDQIAYDPELRRLYCGSALGKIAVFSVSKGQLESLGEVATSAGAKSLALDLKTHSVWLAYAKDNESFVQPYSVAN